MKNTMKKMLILVAVVVMAVVCFAFSASALEETGQCGDNVYWSYDSTSKKLFISGDGTMTDYYDLSSPFYNSDIEFIIIEYGVTGIGNDAFPYCNNLLEVSIPDSIKSIGEGAFFGCESLTNITIPEGVTSIGSFAFYECDNLTSVNIPSGVISIGEYAFSHCDKIKSVIIGDTVSNIGATTFLDCNSLAKIMVNKNNNYYCDEYGVLFNKDKTELICYPIGNERNSYIIPNGVTSINGNAFHNCNILKNIIIANSVTVIGNNAFMYCGNLTSVILPNSVVSVDYYAFHHCYNLTDVFYTGSQEEWENISIRPYNGYLTNATIHYNSTSSDETNTPNEPDNNPDTPDTTITGTFEDYKTTTVVIINGSDGYNFVSEITVEGEKYKVEDEDLISESLAESLLGEEVTIEIEDGVVISLEVVDDMGDSDGNDGSGNGFDYSVYKSTPKISGNSVGLIYDNDWWKWNKKKFQVSGLINNTLSKFDTNSSFKAEKKKEYYNSKGINQLNNIYITLKSPDIEKIYFKGEKSEITFPLGRIIGAGNSDTFECDVYVNRDYIPVGGSEVITLECILNGNVDGEIISGVYSNFEVRLTNESYKWEKQSLKELITEIKSLVRPYESYYRQNIGRLYGGTALLEDIAAVEIAYSIGEITSGVELQETLFDISYYFSSMNVSASEEYGKMFMDELKDFSGLSVPDRVKEIIGAMESRLLKNEYFDGFVRWCYENYGVASGAYSKYSNHCPTDIIVTAEDGKTVLKIINDEIVLCDDYIFIDVFESRKTFYLPTDIDHEVKIIATDDGTMDYSVETFNENGEKRIIEYNDISLTKNTCYTAIAPSDPTSETETYNLISDNGVVIKANNEQIEHSYNSVVTTPTCTSQGFTTYTCFCGDTYKADYVPATGHSDNNADSLCDSCDENLSANSDNSTNCSHLCHKNGFMGFIWKIVRFFYKLLGSNKVCSCGVAHY